VVSAPQIAELARGAWIANGHNIILAGPIGTGKTHLAIALGVEAAKQRKRVLFSVRFSTLAPIANHITRAQAETILADKLAKATGGARELLLFWKDVALKRPSGNSSGHGGM